MRRIFQMMEVIDVLLIEESGTRRFTLNLTFDDKLFAYLVSTSRKYMTYQIRMRNMRDVVDYMISEYRCGIAYVTCAKF